MSLNKTKALMAEAMTFVSENDHLRELSTHIVGVTYEQCVEMFRTNNIRYLMQDGYTNLNEEHAVFLKEFEKEKLREEVLADTNEIVKSQLEKVSSFTSDTMRVVLTACHEFIFNANDAIKDRQDLFEEYMYLKTKQYIGQTFNREIDVENLNAIPNGYVRSGKDLKAYVDVIKTGIENEANRYFEVKNAYVEGKKPTVSFEDSTKTGIAAAISSAVKRLSK